MTDYRAIVDRIKGPLVPIIPAFGAREELDLDSTCKWLDWEIRNGIPLCWLTGSSEPMLAELADMGGWAALKASMVHRGLYRTWRERFPQATLTEAQAQRVEAHPRARGVL